DVLDRLLAAILELERELVAHLLVGRTRNADAARLGELLEPRGYVDSVAEHVIALDDDVTDIDSDAELDALLGRHVGIAPAHPVLDRDRALHGIDDARELDQDTIAGRLDDTAVELREPRVDRLDAMSLQGRQGADLVGA